MSMNLKFKELKKYLSVIDRLSICFKETLEYHNYHCIREVPNIYDELYVYGIGRIESKFEMENEPSMSEIQGKELGNGIFLGQCIEIVVSEKPRSEYKPECSWNEYARIGTRFPQNQDDGKG